MTSISQLPDFPPTDSEGNCDAIQFARVSIARDIIRQRRELGLTQQQLAKLAKVRQESISRLETGKHTPTRRLVQSIERAFRSARRRTR